MRASFCSLAPVLHYGRLLLAGLRKERCFKSKSSSLDRNYCLFVLTAFDFEVMSLSSAYSDGPALRATNLRLFFASNM